MKRKIRQGLPEQVKEAPVLDQHSIHSQAGGGGGGLQGFGEFPIGQKGIQGQKDPDAVAMERDLNRLKADNGKGEYVIYKGAFLMETETVMVSFNPTIVMRPELVNRNVPLTAETYRNDMTEVAEILDDAIADGFLTEAQKKRVMDKMEENLAGIKSAPVP